MVRRKLDQVTVFRKEVIIRQEHFFELILTIEPPRVSRRLVGFSQAAMADPFSR